MKQNFKLFDIISKQKVIMSQYLISYRLYKQLIYTMILFLDLCIQEQKCQDQVS